MNDQMRYNSFVKYLAQLYVFININKTHDNEYLIRSIKTVCDIFLRIVPRGLIQRSSWLRMWVIRAITLSERYVYAVCVIIFVVKIFWLYRIWDDVKRWGNSLVAYLIINWWPGYRYFTRRLNWTNVRNWGTCSFSKFICLRSFALGI